MPNSLTSSGLTLGGGLGTGIQQFINGTITAGYSIGTNNASVQYVGGDSSQTVIVGPSNVGEISNVYYHIRAEKDDHSDIYITLKLPSNGRYMVVKASDSGDGTSSASQIANFDYLQCGPTLLGIRTDTSQLGPDNSDVYSGGSTLASVLCFHHTSDLYDDEYVRATILRIQ